jgi:hypothetical protein
MKARFFSLLAIIIIAYSCTSTTTEQDCTSDECLKKEAYDKVIDVHDEVMPKMAYISELKGQIEERMNASADSLVANEWKNLMINLDVADEAMWVWMRQFNSDLEKVDIDEALEYLKSEQVIVEEVARKINTAIAAAEESLKK